MSDHEVFAFFNDKALVALDELLRQVDSHGKTIAELRNEIRAEQWQRHCAGAQAWLASLDRSGPRESS